MSEPNAEEVVVEAARREAATPKRAPRVQKVTMQSKGDVDIPEDDERVANLIRMGMSEVEARTVVHDLARMW